MPSRENVLKASSGADVRVFEHQRPNEPKRSRFDLSRITNFTCDSGMIIPFDYFETVPGDSFDLSSEVAIESLPTITTVLTPYHVRTYWFYCRNSDLWAGWETFVTRGRSGNVDLSLPRIVATRVYGDSYSFCVPHSLQSFLGSLPIYGKNTTSSRAEYLADYLPYSVGGDSENTFTGYHAVSDGLNALPFMMYQNICKYYFVDENLLQGNTALFPEQGDSDWRLPYSFDSSGYVDYVDGTASTALSGWSIDGVYKSTDTKVALGCLRYAQFEEDYFTSGLPWIERGSTRTLNFDIDLSNVDIVSSVNQFNVSAAANNAGGFIRVFPSTNGTSSEITSTDFPSGSTGFNTGSPLLVRASTVTNALSLSNSTVGASITANQLRELIAYSIWQERNARVDGSYNSMIWVHFSENPKSPEHQARYIGGTSSYINFSEIYQQSESGDTPLGTVAARGSLYEQQRVGRFECPDYGFIMGVMVISPMVTYNTSTPHELVVPRVYDDFYMPEFEGLSPQPVYNKELYTSGNATTDNGLFAYQERYSWLKSRQNVNRGLFRLKGKNPDDSSITAADILFGSATQSRDFDSTPSYSYQFKVQSPANTRRDWLAYPKEPMFKVQIASKVDAVRPMSYMSRPATFGM